MAKATTATYDKLVLELELVANTWTTICGLKGATVNRTKNIDSDETPDCASESAAWSVDKSVRSIEVTIDGRMAWSAESHQTIMDWFYAEGGQKEINTRVRNTTVEAGAVSGETYVEEGPALLTSLSNEKEKGKNISADVTIEFVTLPTLTNNA